MHEYKQVSQHLRAAQQWLSKAERSFSEKKPIRGELDMMLARAELRRAEEARRVSAGRLGRLRCRCGAALIAAGLMLGGGVLWLSHASQPKTQPAIEIVSRSEEKMNTFGTVMPIQADRVIEVRQTRSAAQAVSFGSKEQQEAFRQDPVGAVSISQKEKTDLPRADVLLHR